MAGTRSSKYALKEGHLSDQSSRPSNALRRFPFETDDDAISVRSLSRLSVPFDERFSLATNGCAGSNLRPQRTLPTNLRARSSTEDIASSNVGTGGIATSWSFSAQSEPQW